MVKAQLPHIRLSLAVKTLHSLIFSSHQCLLVVSLPPPLTDSAGLLRTAAPPKAEVGMVLLGFIQLCFK